MKEKKIVKRPCVLMSVLVSGCAGGAQLSDAREPTPAPPALEATSGAGAVVEPSAVSPATHVRTTGDLLPPMERAVTSFGAATDGKFAYVLGGYSGTPHAYSREGQSRAVLRLPLSGEGGWEEVGDLGVGLQGLSAVSHRGQVCHFGGNRVDNAASEPTVMYSVATARCLDPGTGVWRDLPDLPKGRSSHEGALVGSQVFLAGGWRVEKTSEQVEWARDLLVLDLEAPGAGWRGVPAPFQRRAVGVAAVGTQVVVVGGITPEREVSQRVDVFDTETQRWSRGPDYPAEAFGVAVTSHEGAIYASARDGVLRRWAPGDGAWTDVKPLLFGRFFHQLVSGPEGLIALGGIEGMHTEGRTRQVERLHLGAPEPRVSTLELDFPGAAKNRSGWFVDGERLYLFGGNNGLEQHDFEPERFVSEGWRLHLAALHWQRIADFPLRRQTMQTARVGGAGLVVGGFGHEPAPSANGEAQSHGEAFLYDFGANRWTERAGLSRGRTQFGLAVHGDRLWIFGGLNYDASREGAEAFDHVTDVLVASAQDVQSPFVPSGVELPGPRRAFAGAVLGDKYYLVGGMRGGFELVEDCHAFDFRTRTFATIACPSEPRLSGDLVAVGGKLYLVGGSVQRPVQRPAQESAQGPGQRQSGLMESRQIQVYDPENDRWTDLGVEVPFETRHMRALAYDGRLLLVSTHQKEARIRIGLVEVGTPREGATAPAAR